MTNRRRARRQLRALLRIYGGCIFCGRRKARHLQRHHVIRRCQGGPCTLDNLRPVCRWCHSTLHLLEDSDGEQRHLVELLVLSMAAAASDNGSRQSKSPFA
jgi:hypothetical protein